jgi:hypothetical protein
MKKVPTPAAHGDTPWRKHLMALFLGSVLIMVRSLFRIIEYLQGFSGYLLSHEVYLYIFDAVLMWAVMVLFNLLHPSEIIALVSGGNVVKRGWNIEKIIGCQERAASDYSERGSA